MAMKAGLAKIVGTLDEKLTPAKEYVKKKLQEVESGDYRAEELSEVVSRDEVDPDSLLPRWDSKGNLMVRRGSTKAKEQRTQSPSGSASQACAMHTRWWRPAIPTALSCRANM